MLHIHPIPAFQDNYIWIITVDGQQQAWVVDPGEIAPVMDFLEHHQLQLAGILLTHHHADHIGGVAALAARFDCVVIGHVADQARLPPLTQAVKDQDMFLIFDYPVEVIAVPGHTHHHLAFHLFDSEQQQSHIFCGDTLFAAGCGRLFEGSAAQMYQTLQRLTAFAEHTLYYPAHEYTLANLDFALQAEPEAPALIARQAECQALRIAHQPSLPTSLAQERATNPYLRLDQSKIQASIRAVAEEQNWITPNANLTPVDWFHALRQWKNML